MTGWRQRPWSSVAAGGLGAVLQAAACPSLGLWPMGFVALIPLSVAARRGARAALIAGGSMGAVATLLWSETAIAQPLVEGQLAPGLKRRIQRPLPTATVLGAVIDSPKLRTNSVLFVEPDAYVCPTCRYDKQTLLPLAESQTLVSWSRRFFPGAGRFGVGEHSTALTWQGHRLGVLVCYEALFPGLARGQLASGAQLFLNLTNDGWFGDTSEPWLHFGMARLRAIETRRYLIRAAATGPSAVFDPLGHSITETILFTQASFRARVHWLDSVSLYSRWGDWPWYFVIASTLGVALVRRRKLA